MDYEIMINVDGSIQMVYSDQLVELFDGEQVTVRRASAVEPAAGGGWMVDLAPAGGPMAGPFAKRQEALDWEVGWLLAQMKLGPLEVN